MGFKDFFASSKTVTNEVDLILNKLIDMLDNAHVDKRDNGYEFNVGQVTKSTNYDGLDVVIRFGQSPNVRYGKKKNEGNCVIVIDVQEEVARVDLDDLIESKEVASKFKAELLKFLKSDYKVDGDKSPYHKNEKVAGANTRESFEDSYYSLIDAIKSSIEKYTEAKKEIDSQIDQTASAAKQEVLRISLQNLKKESVGSSEKEFIKIMMRLPEAKFADLLEKEQKKKLLSRLADYYESASELHK